MDLAAIASISLMFRAACAVSLRIAWTKMLQSIPKVTEGNA